MDSFSLGDAGPFPVVRPTSASEAGKVIRRAADEGQALFPLGGRTMLDLGLRPSRPGLGVDLTALDRVIDYPARDMTITVEAGITLARLQALLAKEGQRLPVDVPRPEQATLGGALACNTSGPRRYGFGTWRDYVIGITTINDQGQDTKAGGRVVKNVAGYDLCKLHIGALGTLGIISQVTLKLRPLPEENALVVVRCEAGEIDRLLDTLHSSRTRPVCIDVFNPRAADEMGSGSGWAVVVGFEESATAVYWQAEQLIRELAPLGVRDLEVIAGAAATADWRFLTEFRLRSTATLSFKANLLPHAVAAFCRLADSLEPELRLQAHAGSGIVVGHVDSEVTMERAQTILRRLLDEAGKARGNVIVLRCPPAWQATLPVWGAPRGDAALMAAVRDKLDPGRLFNPGRFLVR